MSLARRRVLLSLPLALTAVGGVGFYDILRRMRAGDYNPHAVPSPLIGSPPPPFDLPGLVGLPGVSSRALRALGTPLLVNWFASWCGPCQQETSILNELNAAGLCIWGIAYEDKPSAVKRFLQNFGNPYQRLGADQNGLTAINWGVYGVPESYLVDKTGIVRWRYAGPLTKSVTSQYLIPLLKRYT